VWGKCKKACYRIILIVLYYITMIDTFDMPGAIIAKVPSNLGVPNDCEIWIQGPEPSTTRVATLVQATPTNIPVVNGLQLDVWYDLYARAPVGGPTQGYSYLFSTAVLDSNGFPVPGTACCGNPAAYPYWDARDLIGSFVVTRVTNGGAHYESANAQIPAGTTAYIGSIRITTAQNTVKPPNPVPPSDGGGGGGGGGGGSGFPWPFPDLVSLTPEQMLLIRGGAVVVLGILALALGGD
jgi:hypothetical protein